MRLGLKIHCCAVYSGPECVKCEIGCMPKSMIASSPVLLSLFFFTEIADKKRKFVDILGQRFVRHL